MSGVAAGMPWLSASRSCSIGALVELEFAAPTGLGRDRPDRADHDALCVQRVESGRFRVVPHGFPSQSRGRESAAFTQLAFVLLPHPKHAIAATHGACPLIGAPSDFVAGWQQAVILAQASAEASLCRTSLSLRSNGNAWPCHHGRDSLERNQPTGVAPFFTTHDPRCSSNTGR